MLENVNDSLRARYQCWVRVSIFLTHLRIAMVNVRISHMYQDNLNTANSLLRCDETMHLDKSPSFVRSITVVRSDSRVHGICSTHANKIITPTLNEGIVLVVLLLCVQPITISFFPADNSRGGGDQRTREEAYEQQASHLTAYECATRDCKQISER